MRFSVLATEIESNVDAHDALLPYSPFGSYICKQEMATSIESPLRVVSIFLFIHQPAVLLPLPPPTSNTLPPPLYQVLSKNKGEKKKRTLDNFSRRQMHGG